MEKYLSLSYWGSLSALGVATCCVLPMAMMLLGLGGGWLAVFGKLLLQVLRAGNLYRAGDVILAGLSPARIDPASEMVADRKYRIDRIGMGNCAQ